MIGELHKGRYVYYRCTGYKGRCPEKYAREESIANQFAELLKGLQLDADVQEFLTKALLQSHQDEERFHGEALTRLTTEHQPPTHGDHLKCTAARQDVEQPMDDPGSRTGSRMGRGEKFEERPLRGANSP